MGFLSFDEVKEVAIDLSLCTLGYNGRFVTPMLIKITTIKFNFVCIVSSFVVICMMQIFVFMTLYNSCKLFT